MGQETSSTPNTDIAKAGIEQAQGGADKQVQAPAPAESGAAGAARPAPENPFASEDEELARLEAEQAAKPKEGAKAPKGAAESGDGAGPGKEGTGSPEPADEAAAKAAAEAAAKATAAAHDPKTEAIVALRKKSQELHAALLVKEGENRVLKAMVDPAKFAPVAGEAGNAGAAAPAQTPEQELETMAAERIRIAEEVDAGRMTMREYAEKTNEMAARERALIVAYTESVVQDAANQPQNDLALQEHLGTLITKYPILNSLTVAQLKPFEQIAYEQAELEGKPIQSGPLGTRDLRERMGALATQFYGALVTQPAGGSPAAGGGGAGTNVPAPTSRPTAAEREAKLALAGNHPPNIGAVGSGATGGEPTEAQAAAALAQGEDAAIRWLEANPGFVSKTMGKSVRLTR